MGHDGDHWRVAVTETSGAPDARAPSARRACPAAGRQLVFARLVLCDIHFIATVRLDIRFLRRHRLAAFAARREGLCRRREALTARLVSCCDAVHWTVARRRLESVGAACARLKSADVRQPAAAVQQQQKAERSGTAADALLVAVTCFRCGSRHVAIARGIVHVGFCSSVCADITGLGARGRPARCRVAAGEPEAVRQYTESASTCGCVERRSGRRH